MEIIMALITFIAGNLGSGLLGSSMDWPDAGAIVAISVMGAFILRRLKQNNKKEDEDEE